MADRVGVVQMQRTSVELMTENVLGVLLNRQAALFFAARLSFFFIRREDLCHPP